MNNQQKILILGGSGFVGRHLFAKLGPTQAVATYFSHPLEGGVYFDALKMKLSDIVKSPGEISQAIILLGDTKPDSCFLNLQHSQLLNVESIKNIIDQLRQWKIKPLFASSECIFDGTKGNYVETDTPNPILTYGKQKIDIEHHLQKTCDEYIIVRPSRIYGAKRGDGTWFTQWLDDIEAGRKITCARDQVTSVIYIGDVVAAMLLLFEKNCNGIFHLAGPKKFNKLELFDILAAEVRKHRDVKISVASCGINEFPVKEKRPLDLSSKPDKFVQATGIKLTKVEDMCAQLAK